MAISEIIKGLLIPFLGTSIGAALVFFIKKELNGKLVAALCGFSAGVMIAAAVFSLILPSVELSQKYYGVKLLGAARRLFRRRGVYDGYRPYRPRRYRR